MIVTINGQTQKVDLCNIKELILKQGFNPKNIVVEYNNKIIKKDMWEKITIQQEDKIELLSFVGGG